MEEDVQELGIGRERSKKSRINVAVKKDTKECVEQGKVGWAWVVEEGGSGGVLARTCGLTQREKGSGAAFLDPINLLHLHHHEMAPHTARRRSPPCSTH